MSENPHATTPCWIHHLALDDLGTLTDAAGVVDGKAGTTITARPQIDGG